MKRQDKRFVSYLRVSTQEQGIDGLGIDAQRKAIQQAVTDRGGVVIAEFSEVASGKCDNRIELKKALSLAIATQATIVVAKLDRLGRKASTLFQIRDSVESLLIVDKPDMGIVEFGIFATFAQQERELISSRTKAALSAREARTGLRNGAKKGVDMTNANKASCIARKELAKVRNTEIFNIAKVLKKDGLSLNAIARKLNEMNVLTVTGKQFTACSVSKLFKLFEQAK